jgi:phosphatidylserine/phosphatidylglycerophosphate/cardiolipin synthase-like enzyme
MSHAGRREVQMNEGSQLMTQGSLLSGDLSITFLRDGGQPAQAVAGALTEFLGGARQSLAIAVYDCTLTGPLADQIAGAINAAEQRGVDVRYAYFAGPFRHPVVPPPKGKSDAFAATLHVPVRTVAGFQALMHHKYVVRDAGTGAGAVWTGSTNWTHDSWEREENVILQIPSSELAGLYLEDFEELWRRRVIEHTGRDASGPAAMCYGGRALAGHVWFSPGQGQRMAHAVADAIRDASRRVVVASPVLTDGPILGALRDLARLGQVPLAGVCDATQMEEVFDQWAQDENAQWKLEAFGEVAHAGRFAGKHSQPYAPGSGHDYMHAKMVVVDDTVFTGSFNFSHSGVENAENLLFLPGSGIADACTRFIGRLVDTYGQATAPVP